MITNQKFKYFRNINMEVLLMVPFENLMSMVSESFFEQHVIASLINNYVDMILALALLKKIFNEEKIQLSLSERPLFNIFL